MTEQELISKLQTLRQIKPSQDWVSSCKARILGTEPMTAPLVEHKAADAGFMLKNLFAIRQFAYAFSVLLIAVMGTFGFAQFTLPGDMLFSVKKITEQSTAALTGESELRITLDNLKKRSQDLAEVVSYKKDTNKTAAINEVNKAVKSLAKAVADDPSLAKEVALELTQNHTLLAIEVESLMDLKQNSVELYKAIDEQMIADLEKASLAQEQAELLEEAKKLFSEEKYQEALEIILTITT